MNDLWTVKGWFNIFISHYREWKIATSEIEKKKALDQISTKRINTCLIVSSQRYPISYNNKSRTSTLFRNAIIERNFTILSRNDEDWSRKKQHRYLNRDRCTRVRFSLETMVYTLGTRLKRLSFAKPSSNHRSTF